MTLREEIAKTVDNTTLNEYYQADEIIKLFEKLIDEKMNRIKDKRSVNYYYGVMYDVLENLKEELKK